MLYFNNNMNKHWRSARREHHIEWKRISWDFLTGDFLSLVETSCPEWRLPVTSLHPANWLCLLCITFTTGGVRLIDNNPRHPPSSPWKFLWLFQHLNHTQFLQLIPLSCAPVRWNQKSTSAILNSSAVSSYFLSVPLAPFPDWTSHTKG